MLKSLRRAACEFFFFDFFVFFSLQQSRPQKGRSTAFFPGDIVLQRGVDDFFLALTFACDVLAVMCASDESKCSEFFFKDASLVMLRDASMGPIFGHFQGSTRASLSSAVF